MENKVTITKSQVQKIGEQYVVSVADNFKNANIDLNQSQKQSIIFGVQKVGEMLKEKKLEWKNIEFSSATTAFSQVALCEINMMAFKPDGYFLLRYVDKDSYKLEFAPQGNGARTLVQKFGIGVKKVFDPWIVKENDEFTYPHFKGLEKTEPEWQPKGAGKCVRVVVPIQYDDGSIDYKIAEREDVKANLLSHISNNLTNGKKEDRNYEGFKKLYERAESMTLDQIINDNEFITIGKMSPSWRGINKEQMVITKMIKNALARIPIDMKFFEIVGGQNPLDEEIEVIDATTSDVEEEEKPIELPTIDSVKKVVEEKQKEVTSPTPKKSTPKVDGEDDMPF